MRMSAAAVVLPIPAPIPKLRIVAKERRPLPKPFPPSKNPLPRKTVEKIYQAVLQELEMAGENIESLHESFKDRFQSEEFERGKFGIEVCTDENRMEANSKNLSRMNDGKVNELLRKKGFLEKVLKGKVDYYGNCENCGNFIGEARLTAVPYKDNCIRCA